MIVRRNASCCTSLFTVAICARRGLTPPKTERLRFPRISTGLTVNSHFPLALE